MLCLLGQAAQTGTPTANRFDLLSAIGIVELTPKTDLLHHLDEALKTPKAHANVYRLADFLVEDPNHVKYLPEGFRPLHGKHKIVTIDQLAEADRVILVSVADPDEARKAGQNLTAQGTVYHFTVKQTNENNRANRRVTRRSNLIRRLLTSQSKISGDHAHTCFDLPFHST